jgi:hypothetical protein
MSAFTIKVNVVDAQRFEVRADDLFVRLFDESRAVAILIKSHAMQIPIRRCAFWTREQVHVLDDRASRDRRAQRQSLCIAVIASGAFLSFSRCTGMTRRNMHHGFRFLGGHCCRGELYGW